MGRATLALETSGLSGSFALATDDGVLREHALSDARAYSAALLVEVSAALAACRLRCADLGLVCFSAGPGSFTGLRVAATVATMLQAATGCAVVAAPTLEVIAMNALQAEPRPTTVVALLDAKRGQAYAAAYDLVEADALHERRPPAVCNPQTLLAEFVPPPAVLGGGAGVHRLACEAAGATILPEDFWQPRAVSVLHIGQRRAAAGLCCRPHEIVPIYVRPPECEEVYDARRAAARTRRGD